MDAVARVRVGRVEPLVHQQRLAESVGMEHGLAERPVLLEPVRALHPIEDVLPLGLGAHTVGDDRPLGELVADMVRAEWVQSWSHLPIMLR